MKKLKRLTLVLNNKIAVLILISFFLLKGKEGFAQNVDDSQNCPINNYLEKFKPDKTPTFHGGKLQSFKKNQAFIEKKDVIQTLLGQPTKISISKYKIANEGELILGKGKTGNDSVYYIDLFGKFKEWFRLKKACTIQFYGYNKSPYKKRNIQLYFMLKSSSCNILFCLFINGTNAVIGQYDYL